MHIIQYLTRSVVLLIALIAVAAPAQAQDGTGSSREKELLAVLCSDAPPAEKAIVCKKLAIHGSSDAVADLAKLLPDPQLSSWARIALEVIPGSAADDALRTAAQSLEGKLLIGVVNSIGVRRDARAVDLLTTKLQDPDADVASAAAVALGKIGDVAAIKSLRAALATTPANVRLAVTEGCELCAERSHAEGNRALATEIYDEVRSADVSMQRIIEATRGAILAREQDGIPLLLETLRSPNKKSFQLALATIREFPGGEVDKALVDEIVGSTPERAALMIQAMADRPDTVVLTAVLKAAQQGDKQVRLSAIDALRRVGDVSCLSALLKIAIEENADLAQAAKISLVGLPGRDVDEEIATLLPTAEADMYPLLLELVGQRRIHVFKEVEQALDHPNKSVRDAALIALGETIPLEKLSVLVSQVVDPRHSEDATVARQALKAASVRMPDREAVAAILTKALHRSPSAAKTTLLEILSEVGGTKALETLAAAAKSNDAQLQDAGSRLLGKWNGLDAAPVLLDLAKTAPVEKYRVRALRGYIGLARKFAMPDKQRAEMCRNALNATHRPTEHKLVLDVLQLRPSADALKLAVNAMEVPGLKHEATQTALVIAQKVSKKGVDVSKLMTGVGFDKVKLEIVKAEYGAGAIQKEVTDVVRKQAGGLPLITLAESNYNASFGGDPVPGVPKKLKIQYRMNGKFGEATFVENALIILPAPK
jgi:HEAT repeat protein